MRFSIFRWTIASAIALAVVGCSDGSDSRDAPPVETPTPADANAVFAVANGCYSISPDAGNKFIGAAFADDTYTADITDVNVAGRFLLRPSDLGKYLVYDQDRGYLVSDGQGLLRQMSLTSDTNEVDGTVVIEDRMQSEGEWQLFAVEDGRFRLQHIKSGAFIAADGTLVPEAQAADLDFMAQSDCADFPELTVNASGEIDVTEFEDGDLFGFVDSHSHLFTNLAFGGGGVFHGAPFHPLGVEHALPNCALSHGVDGRKDLMGSGFSDGGILSLASALITGELPEKNHDTEGYPQFTDWPNAPFSSTHQMQYYTWLERAYLSGLRLVVQHATTQETLCQLTTAVGAQANRYDCNDMVAVDRIIEATYDMERYIDAQSGGPGEGWFRIVLTPEAARAEISAGNLAVVLGIETSDLFDCFLSPRGAFERCSEQDVLDKLDEYHGKGVRVLFPVHKMDNGFSAGDGDRRVSDIGNYAHTGHYSNFVLCPDEFLNYDGGFDRGGVNFAELNQPRDEFDSMPPVNPEDFDADPVGFFFQSVGLLSGGSLEGEYCQNHGLTPLGEFLMSEMMKRGMVMEVDHFSRRSYKRAYEILVENEYPAVGTHGRDYNGLLYELGGVSTSGFGRCRDPEVAATTDDSFQRRLALMKEKNAYPGLGFGFDLNGFAGYPKPRFGELANCSQPQSDPITYPFKSFAGDITLEQPLVGERVLDFNTEGMVHLGLVAEYIEEVRRDGVSDEALEPLFRSAEGYIRVWETSERRALEMRQ
jgi:hypothetical protein